MSVPSIEERTVFSFVLESSFDVAVTEKQKCYVPKTEHRLLWRRLTQTVAGCLDEVFKSLLIDVSFCLTLLLLWYFITVVREATY